MNVDIHHNESIIIHSCLIDGTSVIFHRYLENFLLLSFFLTALYAHSLLIAQFPAEFFLFNGSDHFSREVSFLLVAS